MICCIRAIPVFAFVTGNNAMEKWTITDDTFRKPLTLLVTEDTSRKPVTTLRVLTIHGPAGPVWLRVGYIILKDEERSILYLPNAWLNYQIIVTTMVISPHMRSLTRTFAAGIQNVIKCAVDS